MNQNELKDFILSRITIDQAYWRPRIEGLFEKDTAVTREKCAQFFEQWFENKRNHSKSPWAEMREISIGASVRMENAANVADEVNGAFDELELIEFQAEMARFADQFRIKAVEAFNKNDRYTCAIFYTLYAIALNKELKYLEVKYFLLDKVFIPSSEVTPELSLSESQKKEVVDLIFNRSSRYTGFGWYVASLDLSLVENENLPFETDSTGISFFDFIGICKNPDTWPNIRNIRNQ